jgi:signal transduction histidine kinase
LLGTRIFRTSLMVLIGTLAVSISVGIFINLLAVRLKAYESPSPVVFLARAIGSSDAENQISKFEEVVKMTDGALPLELHLYDDNGYRFVPDKKVFEKDSLNIDRQLLPANEFEVRVMSNLPFGPPGLHNDSIIRLPGTKARFLRAKFGSVGASGTPDVVKFSLVILIGSILIGAGVAVYLILKHLRSKVSDVDAVISRLRSGDLKARLSVPRLDEIGQTMNRFNLMANEIEHLVESLRDSESARISIVQELAHDLRTPIASLKNLLEMLKTKGAKIDDGQRIEILSLANIEVNYFARLVEDLLFMAQVSEPKYQVNQKEVDVLEILNEIIDGKQIQAKQMDINLELTQGSQDCVVKGDPLLLIRMIKNIVENAISFGRSRVSIDCKSNSDSVEVAIVDDGTGFSTEALDNFGKRRLTRILDQRQMGRVSTGLGTFIATKVASLHRGKIEPSNLVASGSVKGAIVKISIPRK